jgi:sigma-B regulation protein RsbU (phosphoserine phosphatase)
MDSRTILGSVNKLVSGRGLEAMTTAAVVAYHSDEGQASVSYAGHPPILYRRTNEKNWSFALPQDDSIHSDSTPTNIPLAITKDAIYGNLNIPMTSGDRLFVYTDGITDARTPDGDFFGQERLKKILDTNIKAPLSELKSAILQALHQHTQVGLIHDDVTLIALEIS